MKCRRYATAAINITKTIPKIHTFAIKQDNIPNPVAVPPQVNAVRHNPCTGGLAEEKWIPTATIIANNPPTMNQCPVLFKKFAVSWNELPTTVSRV